ncbi:hypothetical protein AB0K80_09750 [Streptomyces sp. NPDC052682]|uniref:hypothetical protein n=1 Tax=Streptomyces sp. NPDC052682 TaxID=3154954 RepID=UPI00343FE0D1
MATGGALRPRAALGPVLLASLLLAAPATGCGPPDTARTPATAPAAPAPRTTSPADLCARVVAYWSRRTLDSGTYGDYQSMGLSNRQYEILREVVEAARAERERQGPQAADALVGREARERCAGRHRDGGPGKGPWQ